MATDIKSLAIGYEFPPVSHEMTQERMQVYSDMEHSNTTGPTGGLHLAPRNIHIDPEFARSQGLPTTIADGMISAAWVEVEMRNIFGVGYYKGGALQTKFIKPVFAGDTVTIKLTLKEKVAQGNATKVVLDVNCFNQKGDLVVVGVGSGLVS